MSRRTLLGGVAGGLALAPVPAGPAAAKPYAPGTAHERYVPFAVGAGGGPAGTDRVRVLRIGADSAPTVLVTVPGMFGAANDFRLLARDLVAAVPGVQVWAFDQIGRAHV